MKVEYLYGQKVTDVEHNAQHGKNIVFETGAKLVYENILHEPEIIDHKLTHAEFSSKRVTLNFRKGKEKPVKVILDPAFISVQDATGAVFPHVKPQEGSDDLPPDPSPERVALGPSEPEGEG